jgi:hypothetical protein
MPFLISGTAFLIFGTVSGTENNYDMELQRVKNRTVWLFLEIGAAI